ncbi:hypothetical protein [Streptomyces sp. NPDC086787]|uniref:hypothetical protein n=1 Tax=Streptomyces sp. NPDC086787 TaxID=3365759 RepID=UPI0037FB5172
MGSAGHGGQGLARVAVVVRSGAAPLWWCGVFAAGVGVLPPGVTGRRIGVLVGAALFVVGAAVLACTRRGRYAAPARGTTRAGRYDVLQDRAVTVRNWRRGHHWWLLLGSAVALGGSLAVPAAGGMLLAGAATGLWLKADWLGRLERSADILLWLPVDRLDARGGRPAGRAVETFRATGVAAGDAAPGGGARRRAATPV